MKGPLSPDETADLLAAAMQRVGFAIWQVQGVEEAAATYVVMRIKGSRGMGRQKAHELLSSAYRRTFGSLVTELEKAGILEAPLATRLKSAVEERNWFVHHGRRDTRGMFSRPELYAALIARADKLAHEALALQKQLAADIKGFAMASGATEKQLEEEATRLARSWGIR